MGTISEYIESRPGGPEEISVSESRGGDSLWIEQGDDLIEVSAEQAQRLAGILDAFVSATVLKSLGSV